MKKRGKTARNAKPGLFKTLAAKLNWLDDDGYGEAPTMEQLESRLLMSANPVSEIWSQQTQDNSLGDQAVVAMPLNAGEGVAVTMSAATDVYAPTITSFSVNNNAIFNKSFEISAYLADRDSDTLDWQVTLENTTTGETFVYTGEPVTTPGTGSKKVVFATINPADLGDGTYQLTLEVTDPAGNAASKAVSVRFDTTPPVIESITADKNAVETFTSTKFTINASDNVAVTKYALTINGQAVSPTSTGVATYTFKEAGNYEFVATASDAAGNTTTYSQTITVIECADLKAPTIGFAMSTYYKADVPVRFNIRDVDSLEVNWTAKVINNATGEERLVAAGDRTFDLQTNVATLSVADYADGSYTVVVEAIDKGGNRAIASSTFTIDTVAPIISIETETTRFETGKMVLNVVVDEANPYVGGNRLSINGKLVAVVPSGRFVYDFATPGTYVLMAQATDMAGNIGTVTRTIEIAANTDITPPSVNIVSPAAGSYHSGTINLHANITDNTDSYISWTVRVTRPNGTMGRSYTGEGSVVDVNISEASVLGEYTIEIEAVDAAGNVSVTRTSYFQDTVAPKFVATNFVDLVKLQTPLAYITTPFSLAATLTDANSPDELITWTVTAENYTTGEKFTVATGTGGEVNVGINPSAYASGGYRFTITAVDAAGNASFRAFDTRLDGHPPTVRIVEAKYEKSVVSWTLHGVDDLGYLRYEAELVSTPSGELVGGRVGGGWGNDNPYVSGGVVINTRAGGEGVYTFKITAFDQAGNATLPLYFSVYISW